MRACSLFVFTAFLFLISLAGCGGKPTPPTTDGDADSASADSAPTDAADGDSSDDGAPVNNGGAVAGKIDQIEFMEKFQADPDAMIGQTWEVTGFLTKDGKNFRSPGGITGDKIRLEEAITDPGLHVCREVVIRGEVAKGSFGDPSLNHPTLVSMETHPDERVVMADQLFTDFLDQTEYTELKMGNGEYGKNAAPMMVQGKVVAIPLAAKGLGFLDAGDGRFLEVRFAFQNKDVEKLMFGAEAVVKGRFSSDPDEPEDPKLLVIADSVLADESFQPEQSIDETHMVRMTPDELLRAAENNELVAKIVLLNQVNDIGPPTVIAKPVVIQGVIADLSGSRFVNLKTSDESKTIPCAMETDELREGLNAGDEVTLVGSCLDDSSGDELSYKAHLTNCRIWPGE